MRGGERMKIFALTCFEIFVVAFVYTMLLDFFDVENPAYVAMAMAGYALFVFRTRDRA